MADDAKRAANLAKQKAMSEAGFATALDGQWGPDSERRWQEFQQAQRDNASRRSDELKAQAAQEAERQKAEASKASADAERARAESETIKAKAAADKAAAEANAAATAAKVKEAQDARDAQKRLVETGATVAAIAAGLATGNRLAKGLTVKDEASIAKINKELNAAGGEVSKNLTARGKARSKAGIAGTEARIAGAVEGADKLLPTTKAGKVARALGRAGALKGVVLVAEGIYLRSVVAPSIENEAGRTAVQEAGTALAIGGSTLIADRTTSMATATPIDAKAAGQVEAGRKFMSGKGPKVTPPVAGNGVSKSISKLAGKALFGVGVVTAVASIVQAARAEGVKGATKELVKAVDPTNGLVSAAVEKALTDPSPEPSIKELAKQQAAEREAMRTGVNPNPTATPNSKPGPNGQQEQVNAALPLPSGIVLGQIARGTVDPRQAVLMAEVSRHGLDGLYAGFRPPEMLAREPAQYMSAVGARESSARTSEFASSAQNVSPVEVLPQSGPRGWANPVVQQAAQLAKRAKGQ